MLYSCVFFFFGGGLILTGLIFNILSLISRRFRVVFVASLFERDYFNL